MHTHTHTHTARDTEAPSKTTFTKDNTQPAKSHVEWLDNGTMGCPHLWTSMNSVQPKLAGNNLQGGNTTA